MFSLNSTIPYKLVGARELLLLRTTDIAEAGWLLFKDEKIIPSFVLMRACVETCCLAYYLNMKASQFLEDKNVDVFDEVLGRVLGGTREDESSPQAINVLTMVDHIDKEYDGFRKMYDVMCEYAHPNYRGLLASYGRLDGPLELKLGSKVRPIPDAFGVAPFSMALSIFEHQYNELEGVARAVNDYFESV